MTVVNDYRALASGSWNWSNTNQTFKPASLPTIVTYSFETWPSPDVRAIGNFNQAFWDSFQPLTDKQKAAAKAALDAWAAASGLVFIEVPSGVGDIRFGVYDFDVGGPNDSKHAAAYAHGPGGGLGGDVFVGKASYESMQLFLHEIGHALGLKHPFDGDPTLETALDNYSHTVMSYTSGGSNGSVLGDIDRAAIAYLYGAPGAPVPWSWSWDAVTLTMTQTNTAANAAIHGIGLNNVITVGDEAVVAAGSGANVIATGQKGTVDFQWNTDAKRASSVVTMGADAKINTANYNGSLRITAGDRADIFLPAASTTAAPNPDASVKITIGADGKVNGNTYANALSITAGANAQIFLPFLKDATPNALIKSTVTAGDLAKIYADNYIHGLEITAGAKASVNVNAGLADVKVGDGSSVFVITTTLGGLKTDQTSHFTFGAGGSFVGGNALGTNIIVSAGDTNVYGGKGAELVFTSGKNAYFTTGAGADIVIIATTGAPASAFSTSNNTDGTITTWVNNGVGADGKSQFWGFQNVEFAEFANSLYSFEQKAYLSAFPALKVAYGSLLRTAGVEMTHLAIADLSLRVGKGQINSAQAMGQILATADSTTSVASINYQFFTGKVPSLGGIDFLISPTGPNATNLNSVYYAQFDTVNRYINFAVNLGKNGEAKDSFAAKYGSLSLIDATKEAYKTIFGASPTDAKAHALIDGRIDYLAYYGGDGPNGVGTKAAMVGFLLAAAATEDVGVMAKSNDAWLTDLSDGSAPFAINILDPANGYYKADFIFGGA
ncbi:matrixin family metalloprotease [Caulobacter sp. FWC2]|uniref:matrixin family metalloprotease n=1 Tax=Caulobacter sp. FWC2 TaxID=69664 RepID=UPI001177996C|nr:matrixin family metalloprotease [Caulobacter sp. FWC2]